MLIKAETVRFPVSAVEKFHEAAYFFNRMIETCTNVYAFPYNFSAFLSAFRSVTIYLQAQYRRDPRFEAWYARKQDEMRDDPVLRMMRDLRNEALKQKPIELKFLHGPTIPEGGIETTHLEVEGTTDDTGEIRIQMKVGAESEFQEVKPVVKWVVDRPDEIDILQGGYDALQKIRRLLSEWQQLSGSDA